MASLLLITIITPFFLLPADGKATEGTPTSTSYELPICFTGQFSCPQIGLYATDTVDDVLEYGENQGYFHELRKKWLLDYDAKHPPYEEEEVLVDLGLFVEDSQTGREKKLKKSKEPVVAQVEAYGFKFNEPQNPIKLVVEPNIIRDA